jgi:putative ABC transport system permease protein
MLGSLWRRLVMLFGRDRLARDLDEELGGHYDALREAFEADGHPPGEAARLARLRLGGAVQLRERAHDEWRLGALEGFGHDLRLAARSLRRRPGFATAAIATLALGIGASTAIFSVAYGVSLRPLPYPHPDRLLRLYEANPANRQLEQDVSDGAFQAWREGAASLESAALYSRGYRWTLALGAERERVTTMSVTPAFFDVLGVRLLMGDGFKPERQYTRFTTKEIVLSHEIWQRLFSGRADIVGSTVTEVGGNDDDVYRIVGVAPRGFVHSQPVDIWRVQIIELPVGRALHNLRYDRVVARLKPGVTIDQARMELEAAAARLAAAMPSTNTGWTVTVKSLHASIVGDFARATWLLLAAVAVVLFVACLNVGGLLVARAVARERETAVRAALGAGAGRLLRLWLAEAAVLGVSGAAIGVALAWLAVSALKAAAPPGIPRLEAVALDWPTLAVAALATALAIASFTVAPLSRARRRELAGGLRTGSAGAGDDASRNRTRTAITVAQCAGAALLVMLAALLTRSFIKLNAFDLGWNPSGVLSLSPSPPAPRELRRPWYRYLEWSDRLIARLESTPGIASAAMTTRLPLGTVTYQSTVARGRGRKTSSEDLRWPAITHSVSDGYFALMGIQRTSGRLFDPTDRFNEGQINGTAPVERGIAVISESAAKTLWPGQSAMGQALWLPDIDTTSWREVVGIVDDIQFRAVGESPALHVFVPRSQHSTGGFLLLVKADGPDAASIVPAVRGVVEAIEPGTTIDQLVPLETLVSRATAQPRFTSRTVAAFGALALVLAAVGIYGTLSYLVGARTREIGIRLALGAARRSILATVMWRGLGPAVVGGLIGLAAALALARSFRSLLFEIDPIDLTSLAAGAAALSLVAVAATLGPARRASRVDPVRALRSE